MKKLGSLLILVLTLHTGFAQIEITGFGGYMPGSHTMYTYDGYRLKIDGAGNWGLSLGYESPYGGVTGEFSYMRMESTIRQDGGYYEVIKAQPVAVEYYQLGALKPIMEGDTFVPFGLFSLGASHFNVKNINEDYWRFSIALGLGMKYFFTDAVGIRLQARMLMPLYFNGVGFGCGIGTGGSNCGGGAYMGTEILQGDFTGGVVLRINR